VICPFPTAELGEEERTSGWKQSTTLRTGHLALKPPPCQHPLRTASAAIFLLNKARKPTRA
jgi:hypothetical protein